MASFGCTSRRRRSSDDHTSDTDALHSRHGWTTLATRMRYRFGRGPIHHDGIHVRIASTGNGSLLLLDIRTTRPRQPPPSSSVTTLNPSPDSVL